MSANGYERLVERFLGDDSVVTFECDSCDFLDVWLVEVGVPLKHVQEYRLKVCPYCGGRMRKCRVQL